MDGTLFRTTIVLLGVFLAGCADPPAATTANPIDVSGLPPEGEGAIVGHVTDVELLPVAMVAVALAGTSEDPEVTDEAGAFRLEGMEPGEHSVVFQKFGYKSVVRPVLVVADNVTTVDIILEALPVLFPYHNQKDCSGFLFLDMATPLGPARPGNHMSDDENSCTLPFAAGLSTVITKLSWISSGPGSATSMNVQLNFERTPNSFFFGPTPVIGRVDQWPDKDKVHNLTQIVSLPIGSREKPDQAINVAFQQQYTINTMFYYHAPAPEGAAPFAAT